MKRIKRFTIRRIALALAVAVLVPASAQASTVEIPYLSQGVGVTAEDLGLGSKSPDDRAFSRQSTPVDFWNYDPKTGEQIANTSPGVASEDLAQLWSSQDGPAVEIPYLSHGSGVSAADLGIAGSTHPDDRAFSKATNVDPTPVATGDSGYDATPGVLSGFAIAFVLVGILAAFAIRAGRRTRLSPA